MRMRSAVLAGAVLCVGLLPGVALGHGERSELYVPWMDRFTEQRAVNAFASSEVAPVSAAAAAPGTSGLSLVGNSDNDNTVNSDLAFFGNLAYSGHYGGFRILDISADQPSVVSDFHCNGPQNDVSVHRMGGKTFLFQSIDSGQDREDCASVNAPIIDGRRTGYEGVRVFDVSRPSKPRFIDMIQTACGSHTHTLIPQGEKAYIYVASYPLGSGITDPTGPGDFKPCSVPHKKISIIEVSAPRGDFAFKLKEQPLSDDTTFNRGFQACHDVQVFMPRNLAVGSCAGDAQIWDVSDPWNPTTDVEGRHTHIRNPSSSDQFEFVHSAAITWDGKWVAITDETGGGVTANCFGSATTDGFHYYYRLVKPGAEAPALAGRFTIPRDQGTEVCVAHNATFIPVAGRYVMTSAYYQGGVTLVDWANPGAPKEIAYADIVDGVGASDEWSSYWYNGRIFSNSGLNRRPETNRGFDVYRPDAALGFGGAKTWTHSNPQTQEASQVP